MTPEDEEFKRIEREIKYKLDTLCPFATQKTMRDKRIDKAKRVGEPLSVTYSIKLTQNQRIALMRLGPQWIRNQIERSTEFCSMGTSDTGQVCLGRLLETSGPAGGA